MIYNKLIQFLRFNHKEYLYIQDENEFMRQKMRGYSILATLNKQRAGIIESIKERGSVFSDE
ncbi:MAG: hypothetical protein ABS935_04585 [Solibacillus sp.]|uniref:hypothetical protein n=1 Tax=Solibacillus sp. TaxID=1909654 RepID=UPI003315D900